MSGDDVGWDDVYMEPAVRVAFARLWEDEIWPSPYSRKATARLLSRLWLNEKTPLKNGEHCLQHDDVEIAPEPKGYIRSRFDGPKVYAHRAALAISLGRPLLEGAVAMHLCDNPLCCNPKHLHEGTILLNNVDRATKKRTKQGTGRRFLKRHEVAEIKLLLKVSIPKSQIKARYDVSDHALYMIRKGKSWASVEIAPHIRVEKQAA